MRTLRSSFEGYLEIDNRESPGISSETAVKGHSGALAAIPQDAGKKLQMVTKKCGHCPRIVVLNPLRTRERGHCWKHDGFICDECAVAYRLTGECRPWAKQIDEFREKALRDASVNVTPRGIILP